MQTNVDSGWIVITSYSIHYTKLYESKDGVLLQLISIQFRQHKNAFEKIEKDSSATLLPSELAELTIAELKATQDEGLPSLEVLRNAPLELVGHTGFDIHLRYKTDAGLRMDMLLRGFADESGFYLLNLVLHNPNLLHKRSIRLKMNNFGWKEFESLFAPKNKK